MGVLLRQCKIIVSAMFMLLDFFLPNTGHVIWYALETENPPKKYEAIDSHKSKPAQRLAQSEIILHVLVGYVVSYAN